MLPRPTDAELDLLTILWSRGPSTVREIHDIATARRPTQYTTVLKTLQIMAEKGLLVRNEEQRAHVYAPASPQAATERQLAGDLLERAFQGSAARFVQGALSARRVSPEELAEIREMLNRYENDGPTK